MSRDWRKWGSLGTKFVVGVSVALGLTLGSMSYAADEQEIDPELLPTPEELARFEAYMRNIVPVYFPAVPFGWKVEIKDNVVSYIRQPRNDNGTAASDGLGAGRDTTIRMYYTRKTVGKDAAAFMDDYVMQYGCEVKSQQGTGFYTTACRDTNTYAIVIGEVDNLYRIELVGNYNTAARTIIEQYVGNIVNGKKVFADRNIGDMTDRGQ